MLCRFTRFPLLITTVLVSLVSLPAISHGEVYELRTYTTNEGKLDDLHARFRDHTVDLFKKHGIESVGYWVPADEPDSNHTLIYVIRHESRDAAKASWKAFIADPDWKEVYAKSEAEGPILAKRPESIYMDFTDYSPKGSSSVSQADGSSEDGVFELRIYKTNEGKLDSLNARFRDHTIDIFNRYGMQSVGYWVPVDAPDSENTLIYMIRHASRDAAKDSWKSFSSDADWKKVAAESQKDGKFLSERPTSIYMKATDYSALK